MYKSVVDWLLNMGCWFALGLQHHFVFALTSCKLGPVFLNLLLICCTFIVPLVRGNFELGETKKN